MKKNQCKIVQIIDESMLEEEMVEPKNTTVTIFKIFEVG